MHYLITEAAAAARRDDHLQQARHARRVKDARSARPEPPSMTWPSVLARLITSPALPGTHQRR